MLNLESVSFAFPGYEVPLIDQLSLHVKPKSFVSLLGQSGCGKSTIFRLINGLIQPKSGEILVEGTSVRGRAGYCGYMPQRDLLFPWRTVAQNLRIPMEVQRKYSEGEMKQKVEEALFQVGLEAWGNHFPAQLSGGMRQRAAFARTTLTGRGLLLLDEPFSALDFITRISMQEWLLQQWRAQETTILFITHDVEEALYLSDTICLVEEVPIRTLREIQVPGGYPRSREHLTDPKIMALREALIAKLRGQVLP